MWTRKFDFSKRHCWQNTQGKFLIAAGFDDVECGNPQDHPYSRGQSEYMRWIRFFGKEAPNTVSNIDDGVLVLGPDCMQNGDQAYCENYGGRVKAFLFNSLGYAIVEIHDDSLTAAAEKALDLTDASYAEEMNALQDSAV